MSTGKLKWYNGAKGFGFIVPSDGSKDVFVHVAALEAAGINHLTEGDAVSFELATEKGRDKAVNIKKV